MPSNAELITQAEALAEELGLEIETEGLNNEKLAALVSDLKAKKKDAENAAAEDAVAAKAEADEAKAEAAAKKPDFYVMPGKAITSKRGILSDGQEIKADDLPGGADALAAFIKSGHVGKGA